MSPSWIVITGLLAMVVAFIGYCCVFVAGLATLEGDPGAEDE